MNETHSAARMSKTGYNRFLLLVAGLGGLLYGVDVGIISGALPYLEATSGLTANQLSVIVAAVLLGSAISTLFAGILSDWIGRKKMMLFSGILFVISIPVIALAHGYWPLVFGRLLQGVSAGLIGVVVPLYLAECLGASSRGKGTGIFQWLLTLGIVAAALIAVFYSRQLEHVAALGDAQKLFSAQDNAWRNIFWVSLPPGILFVLGSLMLAESPRWLYRRGDQKGARAALLRSRSEEQADAEMKEMEMVAAAEKAGTAGAGGKIKESLLRRKYVIPFLLACVILACNQATGVNSIIGFNTNILLQAGLNDVQAHTSNLIFTFVNFLVTIAGVMLVDKKGRKFLLSLGSAGIICTLLCIAFVFHKTEKLRVDRKDAVQSMVVQSNQTAVVDFKSEAVRRLLVGDDSNRPSTLIIVYSYGDFTAASKVVRSDDVNASISISREAAVPQNKVVAFFQNPFADLEKSRTAPLVIDNAIVTPVPSEQNGWLVAVLTYLFMSFFAVGPGVCVWLALSELMPTRIRSNGMSIALLINQAVSTTIALVFLPSVGKHGYAAMFLLFAGCTVVYFVTATFFLPETKGKTLEEIEEHFEGKKIR